MSDDLAAFIIGVVIGWAIAITALTIGFRRR